MSYGEERLHVRALKDERDKIADFIERSPTYPTFLMHRPLEEFDSFGGWWFGVIVVETQELRALACIENHSANMYAQSDDAAEEMGRIMLKQQSKAPRKVGVRHQIFGEKTTVDRFWQVFQNINRTVDIDALRGLFGATEPGERIKDTVSVSRATSADIKIVSEFAAGHAIDAWRIDPRRVSPQGHQANCMAVIESGRQLVARKGNKPLCIAEIVPQTEGRVMIDKIYVPRPFRTFKKLAATALVMFTEVALEEGSEALLFANVDDAFSTSIAEMAGFESRMTYRSISMRG